MKSDVKAGGVKANHSQSGIAVRTAVKARYHAQQHNQTTR